MNEHVRLRPIIRWTVERVEQLKTLHASGISFGQMAIELGGGISRNSAIGKAKRLGLTMRGPSVVKPEPARTPRLRIRLSTTHERKPPTLQSPPIAPVPTCEPVTFAQLNDTHCRYPVSADGAPILFCGANKKHPHHYCIFHANICFIGRVSLSRAEAELRARLMAKERKTKLADPPMSDEEKAA